MKTHKNNNAIMRGISSTTTSKSLAVLYELVFPSLDGIKQRMPLIPPFVIMTALIILPALVIGRILNASVDPNSSLDMESYASFTVAMGLIYPIYILVRGVVVAAILSLSGRIQGVTQPYQLFLSVALYGEVILAFRSAIMGLATVLNIKFTTVLGINILEMTNSILSWGTRVTANQVIAQNLNPINLLWLVYIAIIAKHFLPVKWSNTCLTVVLTYCCFLIYEMLMGKVLLWGIMTIS